MKWIDKKLKIKNLIEANQIILIKMNIQKKIWKLNKKKKLFNLIVISNLQIVQSIIQINQCSEVNI